MYNNLKNQQNLVLVTLKNDSSPQYLAVPADCLKLHSPLARASEEPRMKYGSMDIALPCGAEVRA